MDPVFEQSFNSVQKYGYEEFITKQPAINADIIFVEFSGKDAKTLFSRLSALGGKKVILTPYGNNAGFLKLALKYKIESIYPPIEETQKWVKLFQVLLKEIIATYEEQKRTKRAEALAHMHTHWFCIVENANVTYISEPMKKFLGVANIKEFEQKYAESETLSSLLCAQNIEDVVVLESFSGEKKNFLVLSESSLAQQTLITFTPLSETVMQRLTSKDKALNRIGFIEDVKNKLTHEEVSEQTELAVVMITITNYDSIVREYGNYAFYELSKEFIDFLSNQMGHHALIANWSSNCYTMLLENHRYEELEAIIEKLHQELTYKTFSNKIVPFIKTATINIADKQINDVVGIIDTFFNKKIELQDAEKFEYKEHTQIDEKMNNDDKIAYYFDNIMYNKIPLKLLNIYKGVHISTSAHIEKIDEKLDGEEIHIKVKNIQLYAMQLERKVVIQSINLPKDIEVDVAQINLEKNLAVIKNPVFLEFSANNRETTRVQSDYRLPIKMKQGKTVNSGEIMDLSIKSVAIKMPKAVEKNFESGQVWVSFKIPVESADDGFFQTQIEGELVKFAPMEEDEKNTKAIILFNIDEPDESYLLEYIYKRQKEIISEIKKLALKGLR